jgi:dienelactone hydrolase
MFAAIEGVFRPLGPEPRPWLGALLAVLFLAAGAAALPARADPIKVGWEPMMLPVSVGGSAYRLETLLGYPDDGRPHPLAILSHGSPRDAAERPRMSPGGLSSEMLWFVSRGWTVAAVMRRGYGRSDGGWAENYGGCRDPDYYDAGRAGAADIAAGIAALGQNQHVDASRVLAVGVSAGAFATIALTAAPPPVLRAAIAFAPGRGSRSADNVCAENRLLDAVGRYGQTSRLPLLWISAANDHYFGPRMVDDMVGAFRSAGGQVVLFAAPAVGEDGHHLFEYREGKAIWGTVVDRFLAASGSALVETPFQLALPVAPDPVPLSAHDHDNWLRYLEGPPHKAFAASPDGRHAGLAMGRSDLEDARELALSHCKGACTIVNLDGVAAK